MISVVIIDDHPIVRAGMRSILDASEDIHVIGEGGTKEEALNLVSNFHPDVLILDIGLPDGSGLEVANLLKNNESSTSVLILTAYSDQQIIMSLLENGATGYVLKDEALETLTHAVRASAAGKCWLSPSVANQVINQALKRPFATSFNTFDQTGKEPLTQRECEILGLLAAGLDNASIASRLTLTKRTVQNHISTIYGKLELNSRTEAMLFAINHGLTRES